MSRAIRARVGGLLITAIFVLAGCGSGHAVSSSTQEDGSGASPSASADARIPGADWLRFDYDAQRTGVGPALTGITARNLGALRLRKVAIDGTVDSSPIELHAIKIHGRPRDVIVVTTTYGRTIALDPGTGARLWEYVPPAIGSYQGTYQITNTTPIADPGRRFVYAASPDGLIHKLAVATGGEVRSAHWPARITFDASREKLAAALNISGGSLIVTTGGYVGDAPPYQGHVVMIDRATGRITAVWNSLCSNIHHLIDPPSSCHASDSAIWARAGAVVEPGSSRILIATGNAPFNGSTDWGDSVLELSPDGKRLLHNWTPTYQARLNATDGDLGSSVPAVLPEVNGRRLALQGGKDSTFHLLDLDRLNGTTGGASSRLGGELQDIPTPGSDQLLTAPVVWSHRGRIYVFAADNSGTAAYILSGAKPRLHVAWQNGSGGTSPVLAGGLLYVYNPSGSLNVFDPTSGRELTSLSAGSGHWNSPIVAGGRVIVPVGDANNHLTSGTIDIYHLPGR